MPHVVDNKIWHNDQKIGWIDSHHIRDEENNKIGYFDEGSVYNEAGYKVAYIKENQLCYENGRAPSDLEHVNEEVQGEVPIPAKCAIKVLFEL